MNIKKKIKRIKYLRLSPFERMISDLVDERRKYKRKKYNMITVEDLPKKNGWYWVLIGGYSEYLPCWLCLEVDDDLDGSYVLPGGVGDDGDGVYMDDIIKFGDEIIQPEND